MHQCDLFNSVANVVSSFMHFGFHDNRVNGAIIVVASAADNILN